MNTPVRLPKALLLALPKGTGLWNDYGWWGATRDSDDHKDGRVLLRWSDEKGYLASDNYMFTKEFTQVRIGPDGRVYPAEFFLQHFRTII